MDMRTGGWQRIADLGEGGFGVVSLWVNRPSNKILAVKCCKKVQLTARQKERWCNEVDMLRTLRHPNIVSFESLPVELEALIENPSNLPLLPMEYCSKGNLRIMLQQLRNSSGLQEEDIRAILEDMSEALQYLHRAGIVHRDFKPENVVLQENNERKTGVTYKLIDLGFAKELDATLSMVGTADYAAPEILRGQNYNLSVDYWSFGIVTHEVICGNKRYPFLPNVPAIRRIEYIRNKKNTDICIYETASGTHYSSKIKYKCHVSPWFKDAIESWLQRALLYDGSKRRNRNGTNLLEDLKLILKKKVLSVYSVYTLDFYYYEIDESVLVSTLKTWINRDTKIHPDNQILLTGKISCLHPNNELLINILPNGDATVVVLNKTSLWNNAAKLPFPDFLTDDMNTIEKSSALYATIFCILNERKHFSALATSLLYLNEHIALLFSETRAQYKPLCFLYHKMATLMEFYTTLTTETGFKYLMFVVKNINEKFNKLERRVSHLQGYEQTAINKIQDLHGALSQHVTDLEKKMSEAERKIKSVNRSDAGKAAFAVVSSTIIKRKETLKLLKMESRVLIFVLEETPKLIDWMHCIKKDIHRAISSLRILQLQRNGLLSNTTNDTPSRRTNGLLDYRELIKTNKIIRLQLEDAINDGLRKFRVQYHEAERFLNEIARW